MFNPVDFDQFWIFGSSCPVDFIFNFGNFLILVNSVDPVDFSQSRFLPNLSISLFLSE